MVEFWSWYFQRHSKYPSQYFHVARNMIKYSICNFNLQNNNKDNFCCSVILGSQAHRRMNTNGLVNLRVNKFPIFNGWIDTEL